MEGGIMKVLVVDDDLVLSDVIGFTLRRAGFEVITAYDGRIGYERWESEHPDLVILDIQLPAIDGLSLCKRIRAMSSTPVIILSVRGEDDDVVHGLGIGADDYIAKPFSPAQLVARIHTVLRRAGIPFVSRILTSGDLMLDRERRRVQRSSYSKTVQLTQLECRLLEILMLNAGQVLAHDRLADHVWGVGGGDRVILKQLVHRLRQKLEQDPTDPPVLENIPGVGYALIRYTASP
jgi:DNA-binding response OmpR family regulator